MYQICTHAFLESFMNPASSEILIFLKIILNIAEKITIGILEVIKRHHINMLFKDQKIGDLVVFEENLIEWRSRSSLFVDEEDSECSSSLKRNLSSVSPITPSSSRGPTSPEAIEVSVHLSDILNDSKKSSIMTRYYERHSKLLAEHRSILISIICCYFEENNLHMSLKTSYRLENEILNRFPGEKLEYYRVGRRGKIYAKACNDKRSYRSLLKRTLALDADASDSPDVEPPNPRNKQFCKYL